MRISDWSSDVCSSDLLHALSAGRAGPVLDLGSGAGFPGLVLAVMGRDDVVLVEADSRKAAFLREAARITETKVTIEACRIEALRPIRAGIVTARALATVADLMHYARASADDSTPYLLLQAVGSASCWEKG